MRNGVSTIEHLKPDPNGRYDYHEMRSIFETSLGFGMRGCENDLKSLGYDIQACGWCEGLEYCDFWHYQLDAVFRGKVKNDSNNSIYVGTTDGVDEKKLKRKPNDWQRMMLDGINCLAISPIKTVGLK